MDTLGGCISGVGWWLIARCDVMAALDDIHYDPYKIIAF